MKFKVGDKVTDDLSKRNNIYYIITCDKGGNYRYDTYKNGASIKNESLPKDRFHAASGTRKLTKLEELL